MTEDILLKMKVIMIVDDSWRLKNSTLDSWTAISSRPQ